MEAGVISNLGAIYIRHINIFAECYLKNVEKRASGDNYFPKFIHSVVGVKPLHDSHLDSEHFSGKLLHRVHVVVPLTVSCLKSDLTSSQDKDEGGIDPPIKAGQVTHYTPSSCPADASC